MSKHILFVNNNVQDLKAFKNFFEDEGYDVLLAENTKKAEDMLASSEITLMICDVHILKYDNSLFLESIKLKYPDLEKFILGDDINDPLIVSNITRGNAIHYISRTKNLKELLKIIENIFSTEKLLLNHNMFNFLSKLEGLPTLKSIYDKISAMIEKDAPLDEIVHLIEQDPVISIKILRLANSALFGIKTASLQQALGRVGFENIKKLILSTQVVDSLNVDGTYYPYVNQIWAHAFYTDKLTKMIYENFLKRSISEIASSAGLYHNIGSIFLLKYRPSEYMRIRKESIENGKNIIHAESKTFGISHEEAGGYLLKWWGLPYSLIEAAMYHHYPLAKNVVDRELVSAVHIAQHYVFKKLSQKEFVEYEERAFDVLGIKKSDFEKEVLKKLTFNVSDYI